MRGKKIKDLIKEDRYQLFVLESPIPFPLYFFRHCYVVVNDHGKLTRWDVVHKRYPGQEHKGYVHKNLFLPWCGLGMIYLPRIVTGHFFHFRATLVGFIEGEKGSVSGDTIASLETLIRNYPHWNYYVAFPGPNSNSFVQWILTHFPKTDISLSAMAVGKAYREV